MSSIQTEADLVAAAKDPATWDPVDGSATWAEFANELTYGYMEGEDADWSPLGPHHREWLDRFAGGESFNLLAHRYALKTVVTLSYIIGKLQFEPGVSILWLTNTRSQAVDKAHHEFNKFTRRNEWLTDLQPESRDVNNKRKKLFANGSSLHAGYLHGSLEGERADFIVFDDIIKEKGDGETRGVWEWVSGAALPIGTEDSQEVFIGTRKRPGDIYEYIRDETAYPQYEYPLILDFWDDEYREDADWRARRPDPELYTTVDNPLDTGPAQVDVLWPERRGPTFVESKRDKTGWSMFQRAYNLVLSGFEGLIYPWFGSDHIVEDSRLPDAYDETIYGVDWGFGNPAVVLTLARKGEDWFVLDEWYRRRQDTKQHSEAASDLVDRYGEGPVYCDPSEPKDIREFRNSGLTARPAENDVTPGIKRVSSYRDNLFVAESCQNIINEFRLYRYKEGDTDDPLKESDHAMDALRYALFTHTTNEVVERTARSSASHRDH